MNETIAYAIAGACIGGIYWLYQHLQYRKWLKKYGGKEGIRKMRDQHDEFKKAERQIAKAKAQRIRHIIQAQNEIMNRTREADK